MNAPRRRGASRLWWQASTWFNRYSILVLAGLFVVFLLSGGGASASKIS